MSNIKIYLRAYFEGINKFMNMWYGLFWRGLRKNKVWAYSTDYTIQFKKRKVKQRKAHIDILNAEIVQLQREIKELYIAEPDHQKMFGAE